MPLVGGADLNGTASGDPTDLRFDRPCRASPTGLQKGRRTHPGSRALGEKAVGKGYLSNAHYDDPQEACEVAAAFYAQEVAGTILHSLRRRGSDAYLCQVCFTCRQL
eukprot:4053329-Pleurochrysis_carterae.AAC.1